MKTRYTRIYPAAKTTLMRCVLFAVAKVGARLHQYSEPDGIVIASFGLFRIGQAECVRQEIRATVTEVEYAARLDLTAPEEVAIELLRLVASYVVRGEKAIKGDSIARWDRFIKAGEDSQRRAERKSRMLRRLDQAKARVTSLLGTGKGAEAASSGEPGQITGEDSFDTSGSADGESVVTVEGDTAVIVPVGTGAHDLCLPENPGMLVQDRRRQTLEVRIDPEMFPDRSHLLRICANCSATNLNTALFCSQCGQALVLEAVVRGEIGEGIIAHSRAGFWYSIVGALPILALLAIMAGPAAFAGLSPAGMLAALIRALGSIGEATSQGLAKATVPILLLVAAPSFIFGRKAVVESRKASQYLNLSFVLEKAGMRRATFGNALGWFDTYAGISLLVLVIAATLMKA